MVLEILPNFRSLRSFLLTYFLTLKIINKSVDSNIMKYIIFTILCFLSLNSVKAQMDKITGTPLTDLSNIFNQNEFTVDIMDDIGVDPLFNVYVEKLKSSIQKNYEWFLEYSKKIKPGKSLEYHPNFGLSESEYKEFLGMTGGVELLSSGKEKLKIVKNDSIIQLTGINKLKALSNIKIDLKNNQVFYKSYTLPFKQNIHVDDADNGFKSEWKGYSWSFEDPNAPEEFDLTNIESLNIKVVKLTIGQLNKNGKVYMKLEERIMENGVKTVDIQVPVIF